MLAEASAIQFQALQFFRAYFLIDDQIRNPG